MIRLHLGPKGLSKDNVMYNEADQVVFLLKSSRLESGDFLSGPPPKSNASVAVNLPRYLSITGWFFKWASPENVSGPEALPDSDYLSLLRYLSFFSFR